MSLLDLETPLPNQNLCSFFIARKFLRMLVHWPWAEIVISLQETARHNYVDLVASLSASSESSIQVTPAADRKQPGSDALVVTSQDGITTITLNRPDKKNALTTQVTRPALRVRPAFLSFLCLFHSKTIVCQHPFCFCESSCLICTED